MICTTCQNPEIRSFAEYEPEGQDLPVKRMNLKEALQSGFIRFFDFDGRSTRAEVAWWWLFIGICWLSFNYLDRLFDTELFSFFFTLLIFLPTLALGARRLHDSGRSGYWQLLVLVPFGGLGSPSHPEYDSVALQVILAILLVLPGDRGGNFYGKDPSGRRWGL
jgi:uncharacterized membrane protein YhaH (DUF805 family)